MILHTVNKSPFNDNSFIDCLRLCAKDSAIVLIEDGVYAGQKNTQYSDLITKHPNISFYALGVDIHARGLSDSVLNSITVIDDAGFVQLVVNHHSVQSWF
jgi:tRNA 2-thiouridine synthesizing protein B